MTESKSVALPLGYSPLIICTINAYQINNQKKKDTNYLVHLVEKLLKWWRGTGSNRRTTRERIYSPPRLATSLPLRKKWCRLEDLNPQPTDYKSVALPIELNRHKWWRMTGSNRRPSACKADALPAELILHYGDPYGIRTRVTAVKGRCLNRLTKGPLLNF